MILSCLVIASTAQSQIAPTTQGFDDVTNLPGWVMSNQSNPLGDNNWFQGSGAPNIMIAQSGDSLDSFIAANHRNTGGEMDSPGTICNYLIMPDLGALDSVSFYTRSRVASNNFNIYPDRLYVVYSPTGEINTGDCNNDFGDFTETLLVINPELTKISSSEALEGYSLVNWQQYSTEISGNGRVAFVYYVDNAGIFGENSNYIGIDSVEWVLAPNTPEDDTPKTPKNCLALKADLCNETKKLDKRIGTK
jgi:hypothetical protein